MSETLEHVFTYIPRAYNDALKALVRVGRYPNRSEAIRHAIKLLLQDEVPFLTLQEKASLGLTTISIRKLEELIK